MAVIGNLYATSVGTGTQILVASSTDLEKATTKYHPESKDTFIVWEKDSVTTTVTRLRSGVLNSLEITTPTATIGNIGLNGEGTKGLLLRVSNLEAANYVDHIDLETMSIINTYAVETGVDNPEAARCIWSGVDEQYYLIHGSSVKKYNVETDSTLYQSSSDTISRAAFKEDKYYVLNTSPELKRVTDNGSSFTDEISSGEVESDYSDDMLVTDTRVIMLLQDDTLIYRDLDLTNRVIVDLSASYSITVPSTLHHIAGTERVFFCGTHGGIRKTFELLEDDSVVEYEAPLDPTAHFGAYSNNNDAYGTEITYN